MVQITVAVSLIFKSHKQQCMGIRLFEADDHATLGLLSERVQTHLQLPSGTVYLLYSGCDIVQSLAQITLKDCCSASLTSPRFSAVYTGDCSAGQLLFVMSPANRLYAFYIHFSDVSILDIKRMVAAKTGIPATGIASYTLGNHLRMTNRP